MSTFTHILVGFIAGAVTIIYIGLVDPADARYVRSLEAHVDVLEKDCIECADSLDQAYKELRECQSLQTESRETLSPDQKKILNYSEDYKRLRQDKFLPNPQN